MSEETITTNSFTESPASWNTRYVTQDGFTCQLTLRAENGKELLEKASSALDYIKTLDCIPFYGYPKTNGYRKDEKNNGSKSNSSQAAWCPIHNVEMKRWEKNGKAWYSHKTEDGWCSGKPKNGK